MSEINYLKQLVNPIPSGIASYITTYFQTDIIENLSNLGLIAGGSILSCFNRDIPVNDIDVFFDNIDNLRKALILIRDNFNIENISHYRSVINIKLTNNPDFQFIMVNDITKTIDYFDFDYIQCGYMNGTFISTNAFYESLISKTIKKYRWDFRSHRIEKAIKKGYKVTDEMKIILDIFKYKPFNLPEYKIIAIEHALNLDIKPLIKSSNYREYEIKETRELEKETMATITIIDGEYLKSSNINYSKKRIHIASNTYEMYVSKVYLKVNFEVNNGIIEKYSFEKNTLIEQLEDTYDRKLRIHSKDNDSIMKMIADSSSDSSTDKGNIIIPFWFSTVIDDKKTMYLYANVDN